MSALDKDMADGRPNTANDDGTEIRRSRRRMIAYLGFSAGIILILVIAWLRNGVLSD